VSVWNQSGVFLVDRSQAASGKATKPIHIEDPKYNSHITDLKPLFAGALRDFPYIVSRNKNAICLIDLRNNHIQPLIEIRNAELFCEKLAINQDPENGAIKLMYVSWQNDRTFVKEITLPS
jgi:hypothetical protein